MPIAGGLIKADDQYEFGKLCSKLEEFGAYLLTYSPGKGKLYAWFRPGESLGKAEAYLKDHGYTFERRKGRNATFYFLAIDWRR